MADQEREYEGNEERNEGDRREEQRGPDEANQGLDQETAERQRVRDEAAERQLHQEQEVLNILREKFEELMARRERGEQLSIEESQQLADIRTKMDDLQNQLVQRAFAGEAARYQLMTAAELRNFLRTVEDPGQRRILEQLHQQKEQQEYYAAMNPLRSAQLQPHWTPEQQKEWFHHQMKLLLETRKGPGVAENEVLWQLIKSSTAILQKNPELKEEYEALMTFYEHFSVLTSATRIEDIIGHASHIKAEDMSRMLKLPFVSEAVRLWEKHGSYKEFLGAETPRDIHGRPLGSIINQRGPALELRKLAMSGEMAKKRLIYELARKKAIDHGVTEDHHGHVPKSMEFEPEEHLVEEATREVERRLGEGGDLNLAFLDKFVHELPQEPGEDSPNYTAEKSEYDEHARVWKPQVAAEEVARQRRNMLGKIQTFIGQAGLDDARYIPDSFFTPEGENMEQVLSRGVDDPDRSRRKRGETIFEEAQLSLYSGESIWRTFERSAFFDGENPHATTSEGGGENPLRRLLHARKYAQELLQDGKIKHADYHIVENLVNPLRDFLSDGSDSFWKNQHPKVSEWYQRMIDTPGKIDQYGRFTDMSDCPFEYIDFRTYQDIPDRSPLYPHYSNFAELAEELRKQEELKPGALLETPTMENYKNFVKLYRNLRSEDVFENRVEREEAKVRARNKEGREPLPSREEASYELFRGLMAYWKDNGIMDDESITNAILAISDAYQESFITPKYRNKLLREHMGKFWGTWPMWEIKQTWGKIDWGAGFIGLVKGLLKGIGGK